MDRPLVAGFTCAVCGASVDVAEPLVWTCPRSTPGDRHHALQLVQGISPLRGGADPNPFLAFRPYLAWDSFAAAHGLTEAARAATVARLDAQVSQVAGVGFHTTPFERSDELSKRLGFTDDGGVWVKDETGQVAGSHKARHLLTALLHLVTAESVAAVPWSGTAARPPLAIASCGNAAIAAATLAAAVAWPITVLVPPWADPAVADSLAELGATIEVCPRLATDPPGDPCIHRFHEHVAAGAMPFSVQGTENVWCLDGGRTIGWEMARHLEETLEGPPLDRLFVQVGGGALAACAAAGFAMSGLMPRLHAVQTEACAPLARAWDAAEGVAARDLAAQWGRLMQPWTPVGTSAADGILDDETYDWLPVMAAMSGGGGSPVVVSEAQVVEAHRLGREATAIDVSATGTAGLAGLLAARDRIDPAERVAVVFSGVLR